MPPEDGVVQDGVTGTVNINGAGGGKPASTDGFEFEKVVPEAFREKPYLKGVDSYEKVFSMLDGAQKKLGERPAGIPDFNTATDEQKEAFFKTFGRPDDPDGYEFDLSKVPENIRAKDEESLKPIKQLFHKVGLNKQQAAQMQEGLSQYVQDMVKAQTEGAAQKDLDFEKLATETFGQDKEKIMQATMKELQQHVPEQLRGALETTSNEQLVALAGAIHSIKKAYGSEDSSVKGDGKTTTGGMTADDIRKKGRELMQSEAYRNAWHPDHAKTVQEVNDTFSKINSL